MPVPVKVHLIVHGFAICRSKSRQAGRRGVATRMEFNALSPDGQCVKCATILTRLPGETAAQRITDSR